MIYEHITHCLSLPVTQTRTHTNTHARSGQWTLEDEHTHSHISCDGQSHFIKLTPDRSQMHWRHTKHRLSIHIHTFPFNTSHPHGGGCGRGERAKSPSHFSSHCLILTASFTVSSDSLFSRFLGVFKALLELKLS